MSQFDLFGGETPVEETTWGPVTRLLAAHERETGRDLWPDEAGALVHEHRGKHRADERCLYCSEDGTDALQRLRERRGRT